jgi:tetratricopeptide (TPR) repeat protein
MIDGIGRVAGFKLWLMLLLLPFCLPVTADEHIEPVSAFDYEKQLKAAIKEFKAAIKKNPKSEEAHLGLIRAYRELRAEKDTRKAVEKALENLPDSVPMHVVSGDIYFQAADIKAAAGEYRKVLQLDAGNARGYFGLFKVNKFEFNRKTAREMLRRAYELDPLDGEIAAVRFRELPLSHQIRIQREYPRTWRLANPPAKAEIPLSTTERAAQTLGSEIQQKMLGVFITEENGKITVRTPTESIFAPVAIPASAIFTVQAVIAGPHGPRKVTLELRDALNIEGIVLTRKFADELNLETVDGEPNFVMAKKLNIGPLEFEDCLMEIGDGEPGAAVDGTIGLDLFERYLVTVDLPNRALRLNPLPPVKDHLNQSVDDPDSWQEMDRSIPDELASFAPLGRLNRHVVVPGNIDNELHGYFYIDTGTDNYCINRKYLKHITLALKAGSFRTEIARACAVYQLFPPTISGTVHMDRIGIVDFHLLKDYAVTLDYRDGLIDFAKVKKSDK